MSWNETADLGLLPAEMFVHRATMALDRFRSFGVSFPNDSRLDRARAIVERALRDISTVPSDLHAEALRTVSEMSLIAERLGELGASSRRLIPTLSAMMSGPDMVADEDDEPSSKPRNLQFEMFLAATFLTGGVPTRYDQPDLRIEYLGEQIGIEAKRVRNPRKMPRRVEDAANQLQNRGMVGLVALNIDGLLDAAVAAGGDWKEIGQRVDQALTDAKVRAAGFLRVKGLVAAGTYLRWVDNGQELAMPTYFKWIQMRRSDTTADDIAHHDAFYDSFESTFARRIAGAN